MKKSTMLATVVALTLAFAGVAMAAVINGNNANNELYGTNGADTIRGFGGVDDLYGRGGNDLLVGGTGSDDYYGGPGNDRIRAVDNSPDDIVCGPGLDRVVANPGEDVARDCETVARQGSNQPDPD